MRRRLLFAFAISAALLSPSGALFAASLNGVAGAMPAYYDGRLFLINFKELPPTAEQQTLLRNGSLNLIYMSDPGLPGEQPFISVLDAIQGDGFNPLWLEVQIAFDTIAPQQFTSDEDILKDSVKGGRLYFVLTPRPCLRLGRTCS